MISERQPSRNYESAMVRAADRSTVIVIKALLYPLISVVTLLLCLLIWRESLVGHYFLIAVLAFICAADFLDMAPIHEWTNWRTGLRGLFDITFRWMLVILFIWMLLRLSGLTEGFNKKA